MHKMFLMENRTANRAVCCQHFLNLIWFGFSGMSLKRHCPHLNICSSKTCTWLSALMVPIQMCKLITDTLVTSLAFELVTIWMVLFLFSLKATTPLISKNYTKCEIVRPETHLSTLPESFSVSNNLSRDFGSVFLPYPPIGGQPTSPTRCGINIQNKHIGINEIDEIQH